METPDSTVLATTDWEMLTSATEDSYLSDETISAVHDFGPDSRMEEVSTASLAPSDEVAAIVTDQDLIRHSASKEISCVQVRRTTILS